MRFRLTYLQPKLVAHGVKRAMHEIKVHIIEAADKETADRAAKLFLKEGVVHVGAKVFKRSGISLLPVSSNTVR
jgi:hypothetical protein